MVRIQARKCEDASNRRIQKRKQESRRVKIQASNVVGKSEKEAIHIHNRGRWKESRKRSQHTHTHTAE